MLGPSNWCGFASLRGWFMGKTSLIPNQKWRRKPGKSKELEALGFAYIISLTPAFVGVLMVFVEKKQLTSLVIRYLWFSLFRLNKYWWCKTKEEVYSEYTPVEQKKHQKHQWRLLREDSKNAVASTATQSQKKEKRAVWHKKKKTTEWQKTEMFRWLTRQTGNRTQKKEKK